MPYKKTRPLPTSIEQNTSFIGERIEEKVERILNNKEPISDNAPLVYTERHEGVKPEYDIRTDRFEVAVEAMDKVDKSHKAKREERMKAVKGGKKDDVKPGENEGKDIGGTEPTQATDNK